LLSEQHCELREHFADRVWRTPPSSGNKIAVAVTRNYTNASPARQVLAGKLDVFALQDVPDYNEAWPEPPQELDGLDGTMEEVDSECRWVDGPWVDGRGPHQDDVAKRSRWVGQNYANERASVDDPDPSEADGRAALTTAIS
jgi:hypothetical protein